MKRLSYVVILLILPCVLFARRHKEEECSDREFWVDHMYRMALPVLENMAEGRLQEVMTVESGNLELSPTWDGRNVKVAYMETFARLMSGLAPWLTLPDDDSDEGVKRAYLRKLALRCYANAVDPDSPDYLGWDCGAQSLVDAAFLAQSLYRGHDALWEPLDSVTKCRYIKKFQKMRQYDPPYTNWLLFVSTIECFLKYVEAEYDPYRIHMSLNKIEEWYVGDGFYSDGPAFSFDYYNSFVIQPMYVECLEMIKAVSPDDTYLTRADGQYNGVVKRHEVALQRMQRYSCILERLISPEGTYPVVGRSIPYRLAVFQPLSQLAWRGELPEELSNGQVRAALTAVMKRMFAREDNYNKGGFLTIGFVGSHPDVADWYTDNGSLYMTSMVFLPLGLPADHPFWTSDPEDWTSRKAWAGEDFPKDHRSEHKRQLLYWD